MASDNDKHSSHQVRLPSGKLVEVVHLEQPRAATEERGATPTVALHVCVSCAGELVYPLDWDEAHPGHWRILLRCPDCESTREGVFGQAAVERLDDELDRATGALLSDFRRMAHANMAEEIDLFIRALEADLIGPSDF
jgi:hypothetical protein